MKYLATDLDGTFIPLHRDSEGDSKSIDCEGYDSESIEALALLTQASAAREIELIYVTGRHFQSVLDAIDTYALPVPSWILCDVGTSIYRQNEKIQFELVDEYQEALDTIVGDVDADALRHDLAREVTKMRLQEPFKQGPHKLSFYTKAGELDHCVAQVEAYLESHSLPYGIIASIDPFNGDGLLDVMPRGASKAMAIDWWCGNHDIDPAQVVFAGDSGNDYAALIAGHRAILVANADRTLAMRLQDDHAQQGWMGRLFLASKNATAGVLQGARWFGLLDQELDALEPATMDVAHLNRVLGAIPITETATRFCVWAPHHDVIRVQSADGGLTDSLSRVAGGYHVGVVNGLCIGSRYWLQLHNGPPRPDPASRFQPDGVHGPSQVVSQQFAWTDTSWQGVKRDDLVIYELHVGAFTDGGTYGSAIDRLGELVELGITAVELMPLVETAGRWNWGYDGVDLFAPRNSYGSPRDLCRFVDAAHAKGLAVIVDVVYNHFGPEGNYLGDFGSYISHRHNTVWGAAPNLDDTKDSEQMRRFLIANAIHWLDEYHIDGLRVDAIHCILDDSEIHWVHDLSDAVRRWGELHHRQPLLIAEANVYDPEMTVPTREGGYDFDAAWCDCFLHGVFAVLRPEERLSNRVYRQSDLAVVLEQGFVYEGTIHRPRWRVILDYRPNTHGLVYSIQNHDFIGNHPLAKRLHQLTSVQTQRAAAVLLLLSPAIPMLFMGEEFCCEHPFLFFVDFGDEDLRRAVVAGRHAEYPQHDWSSSVSPIKEAAFNSAKIGPVSDGDEATWQWYRSLIAMRKRLRTLGLLSDRYLRTTSQTTDGVYIMRYQSDSQIATVAVRLCAEPNANDISGVMDVYKVDNIPGTLELDSRLGETERDSLLPNHAKVYVTPEE